MTQLITDKPTLASMLMQWRQQGESSALVPTMGSIHAGHLALIQTASSLADNVIVTIFVNPKQFAEGEDFDLYPRKLDADMAAIRKAGGAAWESFLRDPVGTLGGDEKAFRQTVTNAVRGLTQRGVKRVAVATHGFPINVMLSELLTMTGLTNFTPHHGSVTRLHADEAGHLRVLSINEMTHITRDDH